MIFLHAGKVGQGKTFSCTAEILQHLYNGIDVYADWSINPQPYFSTKIFKLKHKIKTFLCNLFRLPPIKYGRLFRFTELEDIYGVSYGEIYIDEAHRWLNARKFEDTPPDFISKMSQSRKYHTNLHFITQHPMMVDIAIRRVCNQLVVHKKFFRILYYKIFDGMYINSFDRPEKPPKSDFWGFRWLSTTIGKCYNTYEILGTTFNNWQTFPVWQFSQGFVVKNTNKLSNKINIHIKTT